MLDPLLFARWPDSLFWYVCRCLFSWSMQDEQVTDYLVLSAVYQRVLFSFTVHSSFREAIDYETSASTTPPKPHQHNQFLTHHKQNFKTIKNKALYKKKPSIPKPGTSIRRHDTTQLCHCDHHHRPLHRLSGHFLWHLQAGAWSATRAQRDVCVE